MRYSSKLADWSRKLSLASVRFAYDTVRAYLYFRLLGLGDGTLNREINVLLTLRVARTLMAGLCRGGGGAGA